MKVKELIAILSSYDPETDVVVDGYESGYDDPDVRESRVEWDANPKTGERGETWWSGRHQFSILLGEDVPTRPVVVVGR